MSLRSVQTYQFCSRTLVPLFAIYVAGQAIGRVLYVTTGHLGLFAGPLGELRRAFIEDESRYPMFQQGDAFPWLPAVMFGYLVVVEFQRQVSRHTSRDAMYFVGILLILANAVVPLLQRHLAWRVDDGLVCISAVAAAAALVASRWPRWRGRKRALAGLVGGTGFVIAIALYRLQDSVRLGSFR